MKHFYWAAAFALSFFIRVQGNAQSLIDTCDNAIQLNIPGAAPYEDCAQYNGNMLTESLDIHPCPDGLNNVWYKFVAQGPTACVNVENSGQTPVIWMAHFLAEECMFTAPDEVDYNQCATGENNLFQDLEVGDTYFVSVAFQNDNVTGFDVCVHNPPLPANDEACTATVVSSGNPVNGTVNGATNSSNTVLNCQDNTVNYGVVWYEYTMEANCEILNIDLSNLDPDIEYGVSVHDPAADDCSDVTSIIDGECITGDNTVEFEGLVGGSTYWIRISAEMMGGCTEGTAWGDFVINVTCAPRTPCGPNENCGSAEAITGVVVNGSPVCVEGCTGDMQPVIFGNGDCFDHPNGATWYSLNIGGEAVNLDIEFRSNDVLNPVVSVVTSNNCNTFDLIDCTNGANGVADLNNVNVNPGSTVYILVSDDLDLEGDFDLCISMDRQALVCVTSQEIEVTSRVDANGNAATPLEGPYCPGDQVTFCYRVIGWDQNVGCQWLQGIIPTFGDCWDIGPNDEPDGGGVTPLFGGEWEWYGEGEIDYNLNNTKFLLNRNCRGRLGLCEADDPDCTGDPLVGSGDWDGVGNPGLPPGWYAWDCGDGRASCGDPDEDYGDGSGCTGVQGPWEVCFTLTAMDFMECLEGLCGTDCSVSVWTTADQETGIWEGGSVCTDDDMAIFNAQLNCTDLPQIDAQPVTICSGEQLDVGITSDFDPNVEYTWMGRVLTGAVGGAGSGGGNLINDILTNSGTTDGEVEYTIVARIAGGCQSDTTVIVTVLPQPEAEAGPDRNVCFGFCDDPFTQGVQIGPDPDNVNPDWTYSWTGGSTLTRDDIPNPLACPQRTTQYTLTVTDQQGCTSSDQVTIVFLEEIDVTLTGPDTICAFDNQVLQVSATVQDGGFAPFEYNFALNGFEDGYVRRNTRLWRSNDLFPGTQIVSVTVLDSRGCMGTAEKPVVILAAPDFEIITGSDTICIGGSTTATVDILNFFNIDNPQYVWTLPDGMTIPGTDNIVIDQAGWHYLEVSNGSVCPVIDSVFITALPPLEIYPDTLNNCDLGDGTSIFNLTQADITTEAGVVFEWFYTTHPDSVINSITNYRTVSDTVFAILSKGDCESPFVPVWLQVDTLPVIAFGPYDPFYCNEDDPFQLTAAPAGGVFSGRGVSADGLFDPGIVGRATARILYTFSDDNGCTGIDSIDIDVVTPNGAEVTGIDTICITGDTIFLSADPAGGVYRGSGVVDTLRGAFLASVAGVGTHNVEYQVQDTCLEVGSIDILVVDTLDLPFVSCGQSTTSSVIFNWGHSSATEFLVRIWRGGTVYFDEQTSLTTYMVNNLVNDVTVQIEVIAIGDLPCGNSSPVLLECLTEPCPVIDVTISGDTLHCVSDPQVVLTPSLAGGLFTGNGIIDDSGIFDPDEAGVGRHQIDYTFLRTDSCVYTAQTFITVEGPILPPDVFCAGVTLDSVAIGWSHGSATTFIINVWENGTQIVFDERTDVTIYERGGLQENDSVRVQVIAVSDGACGNSEPASTTCQALSCDDNPPTINGLPPLCVTGSDENITANPAGGQFNGPGIIDNSAGTFSPVVAGVGLHTVSYTYTDDIGCPQRDTLTVEVVDTLPLPEINCFDASTSFIEIAWSHPTQTRFEITYQINNGAPQTEETTATSIRRDGLSQGDTMTVTVIALGDAPCGDSGPVSLTCVAEDCPPSPIDLSANRDEFCITDGVYALSGLPANGLFTSASLGLVDNQFFDPSLAGAGVHWIYYEWNNGANCTYLDSIAIDVVPLTDPIMGISCIDQKIDEVTFTWEPIPGATYIIYYAVNGGTRIGPFITEDARYVIDQLTEFDEVVIEIAVQGDPPCGDSEFVLSNCIALDCNVEILGLQEDYRSCDSVAIDLIPMITGGDGNYVYERVLVGDSIVNQKDISITTPGVYQLRVEDGFGCKAEFQLEFNIDVLLPIVEISDLSCFGTSDGRIEIVNIAGTNPPYEISLNDGPFTSDRLFEGLPADVYRIVVRDAEGCDWEVDLDISEPDFFDFNLENQELIVNWGNEFVYDVQVDSITDSIVTFKIWTSPDTSIQDPTDWRLVATPLFSTFYALNVETDTGCGDEGQINVLVEHDRSVYIPNVFYPGSLSQENQIWKIYPGPEVQEINSVHLFNRWGDLVYFNDGYSADDFNNNFWNGIFNGEEEHPQVYVYVVELTYLDGQTALFKGDVTLLR